MPWTPGFFIRRLLGLEGPSMPAQPTTPPVSVNWGTPPPVPSIAPPPPAPSPVSVSVPASVPPTAMPAQTPAVGGVVFERELRLGSPDGKFCGYIQVMLKDGVPVKARVKLIGVPYFQDQVFEKSGLVKLNTSYPTWSNIPSAVYDTKNSANFAPYVPYVLIAFSYQEMGGTVRVGDQYLNILKGVPKKISDTAFSFYDYKWRESAYDAGSI